MKDYTEFPIEGKLPTRMLPDGWALILEGGGTRGFYSAGVFEAFMEKGLMFPYIVGVSAGAANGLSYVSGQRFRNRQIAERYVENPKYLSVRNMFRCGSAFDLDYIFDEIPQKHIFFDEDCFRRNQIRFLTGALNCNTGETLWFEKEELDSRFVPVRASCSVPGFSKIVRYNGLELADGGTSSPIPIEKSIADGNTFHVIVMTRNPGYRNTPFRQKRSLRLLFRKYPRLVETILKRHEIYNRQVALCEELEREGKALIIRPLLPLHAKMMEKNIPCLLDLYDEGYHEGQMALEQLSL